MSNKYIIKLRNKNNITNLQEYKLVEEELKQTYLSDLIFVRIPIKTKK